VIERGHFPGGYIQRLLDHGILLDVLD